MSEQLERLARLDSCAVSDARDRLGLADGVITSLSALSGDTKLIGRAVTVLLGPPPDVPSQRHLCTAAIEASGSSDVIVIAHQARTDCAGWGGNLSRAAQARGVQGTIIDGAARDIDEANEIGYPVFAAAATPRTARGRTAEHEWNTPVTVAGVDIRPGDYVIADRSGIVVTSAADIDAVLSEAEAIAGHEAEIARSLAAGTPVSEAMGQRYERMVDRE